MFQNTQSPTKNTLISFARLKGFFPVWCQRAQGARPMTNTDLISKSELPFCCQRNMGWRCKAEERKAEGTCLKKPQGFKNKSSITVKW